MTTTEDPFAHKLTALFQGLDQQSLRRTRERRESETGPRVQIGDEQLLSFSSNDYLGLANDPRVVEAFCSGARRYGVGAGASHLLGGHTAAHHELEACLADFVGTPRALVFSTGYMANLALVTTLSGRHQDVFEDRRNHASLLDAARLAQAMRHRYRDAADLAQMAHAQAGGLIVTDGVFSMDGDMAELNALSAIAHESGMGLIVDDAHAFGVVGPAGRGTVAAAGLSYDPRIIHMGTLGKAFGVFGAFVAASADVIEALIQKARTYIYTTALPPAVATAACASLKIAMAEEARRATLAAHVRAFKEGAQGLGLTLAPSLTPIQPVILGTAEAALAASLYLRSLGLLVSAVRPPTVPEGQARLRVTFSAAHTTQDVMRLLEGLASLPRELKPCCD